MASIYSQHCPLLFFDKSPKEEDAWNDDEVSFEDEELK